MSSLPETRFARSDGVDIAYQVVGNGDHDLILTFGWVSNLEIMWELPELASFLDSLARLGRLIIFDKRGTGLSDRIPGMATLEERSADIAAVMDAAKSQRATIVGWGDGAAIAAMFASTHPTRVAGLVLSNVTFSTNEDSIVANPRHDGRGAPSRRRKLGPGTVPSGSCTATCRRSSDTGMVAAVGAPVGYPKCRCANSGVGFRYRPTSCTPKCSSANHVSGAITW
jgi:pimeloyl-ACP methyl ester carboxylesterase